MLYQKEVDIVSSIVFSSWYNKIYLNKEFLNFNMEFKDPESVGSGEI